MFLSHRYFYIQCLPCIDNASAHCLAAIAKYPCRHGYLARYFAEIKSPATASAVPPRLIFYSPYAPSSLSKKISNCAVGKYLLSRSAFCIINIVFVIRPSYYKEEDYDLKYCFMDQ